MTPKKKAKMLKLFEEGVRGINVAKRLNIDPKLVYYHQKKFLNNYIKAIGPDKPRPNWEAVGLALIQLGKALHGHDPV